MALKATMQRRSRQVWDRRLKGVEAVVQGQQCVTAESDNDRLLLDRQDCGSGFFRSRAFIANRRPLLPLGDGLLIDAIALGEGSQALLMGWTALARASS